MPLSLNKLETILTEKGFIPISYFTNKKMVMLIHLVCQRSNKMFFLYIPSKYDFETGNRENVFDVIYFDFDNPVEDADIVDIKDLENHKYKEIILDMTDKDNGEIKSVLEKKYNRPINMNKIAADDLNIIKSIYRQLRRFRNCVQDLEYKIIIIYKYYICMIRRDNSIDVLRITNYTHKTPEKKMYVVSDLEMFYNNPDILPRDIENVSQGIYQILVDNQNSHVHLIDNLMKSTKHINTAIKKSIGNRVKFKKYTEEIVDMMDILNEKLTALKRKRGRLLVDEDGRDMSGEISTIVKIGEIDKSIKNINSTKREIGSTMNELTHSYENTLLSIDTIMFDNCVMTNTIIRNFENLKKIHGV